MRTVFYLFLLLFAFKSFAQKDAHLITRLSFTKNSGGVVFINAQIKGISDTLTFILDTGSSGVSVDSTTCANNHLLLSRGDTSVMGIGGIEKVPVINNRSLMINALEVNNLSFRVYNYIPLSEIYGTKIDGVLGYDFFCNYIIKIDYDLQMVEIFSKGKIKYPKGGFILHTGNNTLPIYHTEIKDNRKIIFPFFMDTGAGLPVLLNDDFIKDSGLMTSNKKVFITRAAGFGGKKEVRETIIKRIKLGPYFFYKVPAFLFNDNNNITQYPFSGGLLGSEFLKKFNLVINYDKNEFYLKPNSYFDEPFDYGYSGVVILLKNDKIIVDNVVDQSPGALAGLIEGDEILGIDHNFSGDLDFFKQQLQDFQHPHILFIKRNGDLFSYTIKPISIL